MSSRRTAIVLAASGVVSAGIVQALVQQSTLARNPAPRVSSAGDDGGVAGDIVSLDTFRVAQSLLLPIYVGAADNDHERMFVIEKRGIIKVFDKTVEPWTLIGTYLNIDSLVGGGTTVFSEQGLLGLAFDPDYLTNGRYYLNYTNNSGDTVIARYTDGDLTDNVHTHAKGSPQILLTIGQPQANHNGGWMGFGPDGYLYINTGDGGASCDAGPGHSTPLGNAQDTTSNLLGKILRIDVSGTEGYTIPADNPFVGIDGDDEILHYGLRNPWRSSFDRLTGDLIVGDVGQNQWEEIDFIPATDPFGLNYGWRCYEGNAPSSVSGCSTSGCPAASEFVFPIHVYSHGVGISVTGGYVYRGCNIPSLDGTYFFADYGTAQIWSGYPSPDGFTNEAGGAGVNNRTAELASVNGGSIGAVASFGEDALGEIYIVDQGGGTNGEIFKIVPTEAAAVDCNANNIDDFCDLLSGLEQDCNLNEILDSCDIDSGFSLDCNLNGVPDDCDIAGGTPDCNANGVPDDCEPDCNDNQVADDCDISGGTSQDCDLNGVPDECQPDCNDNQVADVCDISGGTSQDCDLNGVPDECDILSSDCNANQVPDSCDIASGEALDCNENLVPDACDIASGKALDCNENLVPDSCDIAGGTSTDTNGNGVPDECEPPPPTCSADISPPETGDNNVGPADLGELLANWGPCTKPDCPADISPPDGGDDIVGPGDLGELLAQWGKCPT